MKSGIIYKQGDIILIPFPFTDLSGSKKRPAMILSKQKYNKVSDDFILCGITSNLKNRMFSILITKKDLEEGFIPKKSIIKTNKIFSLKQNLSIKKIGKVKKTVIDDVKNELFKLI